jgi:hypothetical protein
MQMATVRLRDGEVTLYTRGDSKNWYAGFRLARGGRLQESLKTRNKAVAKERALERHDDLRARAKYGLTQNTVTFAHAADAWLLVPSYDETFSRLGSFGPCGGPNVLDKCY